MIHKLLILPILLFALTQLSIAQDGLQSTDSVTIVISAGNQAPIVDAGPDRTIDVNDTLTTEATVSDDGLPNPPGAVSVQWTKVSGPGDVIFGDPTAVVTTATFSVPGVYVLQLTATDGIVTQVLYDWDFETNVGTIVGSVATVPSIEGNGLAFNGGQVNLGNLDIIANATTIAAWINPSNFTIPDARIISKTLGVLTEEHFWMLSTVDDEGIPKLRSRLRTDVTGTTLIIGSQPLVPNTWTHVALTYDGIVTRLYQDGVEVGLIAQEGAISIDNTVPITIGNMFNGLKGFNGVIDEVKIYNKALTQNDILQLMNGK